MANDPDSVPRARRIFDNYIESDERAIIDRFVYGPGLYWIFGIVIVIFVWALIGGLF